MRVKVDEALCQLHGQCMLIAPDVFEIRDDRDTVVVRQEHPPDSLREDVEAAVRACPVRAISVIDE